MDRRGLLARMAVLLGAVALPSNAFAGSDLPGEQFLDAGQMRLLSAVADTIIPQTDTPGALTAKVPEKLDAMLVSWASPERRNALLGALARIDAFARDQKNSSFAEIAKDQRHDILTAHDLAALKPVPRLEKVSGFAALSAEPAIADPAYGKLKELIVLLYYYSEEALTTELAYEHSPGDWTASIKVTPETRPSGGITSF